MQEIKKKKSIQFEEKRQKDKPYLANVRKDRDRKWEKPQTLNANHLMHGKCGTFSTRYTHTHTHWNE